MGCCSCCGECLARTIIGVVNFVMLAFAIIACALLWLSKDKNSWMNFDVTSKENVPFIIMIVIAAFAALASLVGFFILCCKNMCWRATYLVLIIIAIILEVVGVVLAFKYPDTIVDSIGNVWDKMEGEDLKLRGIIEGEFSCCGWKVYNPIGCNVTLTSTPDSCYNKLKASIDTSIHKIGYVVIALVAVEFFIFILAIYLVCKARRKNENDGITNFA